MKSFLTKQRVNEKVSFVITGFVSTFAVLPLNVQNKPVFLKNLI